jgi:hypothetical protein
VTPPDALPLPVPMTPFQAIQYVGTPIALVAFIVALAAYVYRSRLVERRRLIEAAPESDRGRLLDATIRDFTTVNTETLTREQRYTLALRLIEERAARFRLTAYAGVFTAVILAVLVAVLPADADEPFVSLTVRVQDDDGSSITAGDVTLDAGAARSTRPVGGDGQVRFENIPRATFSQGVLLMADVPGFASQASTLTDVPAGGVHYLTLERTGATLYGTVVNADRSPMPGVVLIVDGGLATDTTDAQGTFSVQVPHAPGARVPVRLLSNGLVGFNDMVTIPSGEGLTLRFDESR